MEFLKIRNISAIFKKFKKEVLLNVLLNVFSDILILFGILAQYIVTTGFYWGLIPATLRRRVATLEMKRLCLLEKNVTDFKGKTIFLKLDISEKKLRFWYENLNIFPIFHVIPYFAKHEHLMTETHYGSMKTELLWEKKNQNFQRL